jgi:hypothetical protein
MAMQQQTYSPHYKKSRKGLKPRMNPDTVPRLDRGIYADTKRKYQTITA